MSQGKKSSNPAGVPLDALLAQWRRERPDLDPAPMAVCGAVWRAYERLRQGLLANISPAGLDRPGFDVLLTLRRQGKGRALSPSGLAKEIMLSTSAMTNRLDRLEKKGLIERRSDPGDRRGLRIVLTEEGFALADRLVASHVAAQEAMLGALDEEERATLRRLLEKIADRP
ncbi:MarR family winged helix-turn-helix transcriptional regulator [Acanthopleuribacter pedis]|uniref:MarR family transcriptional regulator n=1 Tax=Acanthopleuribacter pedis TaxID=442870 RepID=A0A8J7PZ69_9BACT|nr:MarR family transcriptional regulator [Acanthopleuribacter pedis]MBO1317392.1 MarR family transcriptional regulator [Acanthopleuribacter pedis]